MQTHTLSPELYWLTITTLMTGLMWVPYILNRLVEKGPLKATWDPQRRRGDAGKNLYLSF